MSELVSLELVPPAEELLQPLRFHFSLNVSNLNAAIEFYGVLSISRRPNNILTTPSSMSNFRLLSFR